MSDMKKQKKKRKVIRFSKHDHETARKLIEQRIADKILNESYTCRACGKELLGTEVVAHFQARHMKHLLRPIKGGSK